VSTFLDVFPIQWTDPRIRELYGGLTGSLYRQSDIEEIVVGAGVPPANLAWEKPARNLWFDAMNEAAGHQRLRQLVEQAIERYPALKARVEELLAAQPVVASAVPANEPAALGPTDSRWKGFSPDGRERQIVEDDETLLDISFLERGLRKAGAVCRLTVRMATGAYHGTAFRIGPSLLLTNHHVLYDWDDNEARALSVEAAFGYEIDLEGKLRTPTVVACDVATIRGERAHDFALISAAEPLPDSAPSLSLEPAKPVRVDDRVVIVQHPEGLPKKIALAHNLVRHVDDDVIQYWTDTEAGSSGSPVFDESWDLVALHHQWIESPADDGHAFRNQGRNIRRVAERITAMS
jgi:V8-like Glu-specific endopeptidase